MKRYEQIVDVESVSGWRLRISRLGDYFRADLESPDGKTVWTKALSLTIDGGDDDVYSSVLAFLANRDLYSVGRALVEQARAEIKMSGAVT